MKKEWYDWLGIGINGFFIIFFILYIGKFGLSNFILEGTDKWKILLNIGIWFALINVFIKEFFELMGKGNE